MDPTRLQSLYSRCTYWVKLGGRIEFSYFSCAGVKQGYPFRPTPFEFIADGVHRVLALHLPDMGPAVASGVYVPVLQCPDDAVVMAMYLSELQTLVTVVNEICQEVGFTSSPRKSCVVQL